MSVLPRSIINRIVAENVFEEDIGQQRKMYCTPTYQCSRSNGTKNDRVPTKPRITSMTFTKSSAKLIRTPFPSSLRAIVENFHRLTLITLTRQHCLVASLLVKLISRTLTLVCNLSLIQCPHSVKKCPLWCRRYHQQYIYRRTHRKHGKLQHINLHRHCRLAQPSPS